MIPLDRSHPQKSSQQWLDPKLPKWSTALDELRDYIYSPQHCVVDSTGLCHSFELINNSLRHVFLYQQPLQIEQEKHDVMNQELPHRLRNKPDILLDNVIYHSDVVLEQLLNGLAISSFTMLP